MSRVHAPIVTTRRDGHAAAAAACCTEEETETVRVNCARSLKRIPRLKLFPSTDRPTDRRFGRVLTKTRDNSVKRPALSIRTRLLLLFVTRASVQAYSNCCDDVASSVAKRRNRGTRKCAGTLEPVSPETISYDHKARCMNPHNSLQGAGYLPDVGDVSRHVVL